MKTHKKTTSPRDEVPSDFKRLRTIGTACLLSAVLLSVSGSLPAQTVEPNYGAPLTPIDVCGDNATFHVKLNGGVGNSGALSITLPTGYQYVPNSHVVLSGGLTISQTSAANNAAVLQINNIPAGVSEFTYQAHAGCGVIGTGATNQVTYKLGANPNVLSNPLNAQNAKLNITNVTNSAYVAATPGAVYTRTIAIQNGGFGSVNELNLSETNNGLGIGAVTVNAGTVSVSRSLVGADSVINIRITPAGGSFASNNTLVVTETVTVIGCNGGTTGYDAWYGCPDKCTASNVNGTATAGATVNSSVQPNVVISLVSQPDMKCLPTAPAMGWVVFQAKNTSAVPAVFSYIKADHSNSGCTTCTGPVSASGMLGGNTCGSRTMYIDTAAGVQYSMDGGNTWTNLSYAVSQYWDNWAGGLNNGQPVALSFINGIPSLSGGDSVRIRYRIYDAPPSCCIGDWYQASQIFSVGYTDVCGNNLQLPVGAYTTSGSGQRYSMQNVSDPDAVAGQPYYLTFQGFINSDNNAYRTAADGYIDYELTLPTSLNPSLLPADNVLTRGSVTKIPDNVTWDAANRKLRIRFLRSNLDSHDYIPWTLSAKTSVNCSGIGNTAVMNAFVKLADCATTEWKPFCNVQSTFTMHSCTPCVGGGLVNKGNTVQRTNYGLYSGGNNGLPSGILDTSKLNLAGTVYGDTIAVKATAVMEGSSSYTNAYLSIAKSEADAVHPFIDATAYVYNSGILVSTITGIGAGSTSGSNPSTRTLDLRSGTGVPASFAPGDSIYVVARFRQLVDADRKVSFTTKMYASNSALPSGLPQFSCDSSWTATLTNYTMQIQVNNATVASLSGCTPVLGKNSIGYQINPSSPSEQQHLLFPYEIREIWDFDSVRVVVPTGFDITNMNVYVSGQGATAQAGIATYPLAAYNAATNTYYYNISTLSDQMKAAGVPFTEGMRINFQPTYQVRCRTGNFGPLNSVLSVHSHNVATDVWSWGYPMVITLMSTDNTMTPLNATSASPNLTVNGNNVSWEVQMANPTTATKPNAWLARATGVSTVTITNVQELTGAGGTVVSTVPVSGGIYQLGSIPGGASKYYRVNAAFSNCVMDSIKLGYDHHCSAYPTDIAAGETGCRFKTLTLRVNAQAASVQTTIISQPPGTPIELCATLPYEVEIRNPSLGILGDTLMLRVQLPTGVNFGGVQFVPGTAQLQAPNASYPNGSYTAIPDAAISYQQVAGVGNFMLIKIPQAALSQLNALEAARLKFSVRTTSCDFVSGSSLRFRGEGANSCDETVSSGYQQAQNVTILGSPTNPILFVLSSKVDTVRTCTAGNSTTQYRFVMVNNGPATTDTNYRFRIALPAPWTMNTSSLAYTVSGGSVPVFLNQSGGFYHFKAGSGLGVGDSMVMVATLQAPSSQLTCGASDPILEQATVSFTATCIVDNSICPDMGSITSEREQTAIVVDRPVYAITSFTGAAAGTPPTHLTGSFTLQHGNSQFTAQNGVLKVYKDVNQNGILEAGDSLLGSQTYAIANLPSQTFNYDISTAYHGNVCPVIAVLEMDCACAAPVFVYNCANIALPIRFKDERLTLNGCQVNLAWDYGAEQTIVAGFEVERKTISSAQSWEQIGTTGIHETRFTDVTPFAGNWIYRIKAKGTNGEVVYSRTLPATTHCTEPAVSLFPNPARNVLQVTLQGQEEAAVSFSIVDNLGRLVRKGVLRGNSRNTIDISGIRNGSYHLHVIYAGMAYVQQFDVIQ